MKPHFQLLSHFLFLLSAICYVIFLCNCYDPNSYPQTFNSVSLGPISQAKISILTLDGKLLGTAETNGFSLYQDTLYTGENTVLRSKDKRRVGKFGIVGLRRSGLRDRDLIVVKVNGGVDVDPNDDGYIEPEEGLFGPSLKGELYAYTR